MASHFDRWEKDPYFSAAEEVQESADRMESTYRTWIHAIKDASSMWNSEEIRRDLHTALGTTKWQLEEFERAVRSSYTSSSLADDAKDRHRDFIIAIESQISKVESSLRDSVVSGGKRTLSWVCLNEGECDELAVFLTGPPTSGGQSSANTHSTDEETANLLDTEKQSMPECSKNSSNSVEWGLLDARPEKLPGHRRTASATADIGAWNITIANDVFAHNSSNGQPEAPPRRIPSFSGFPGTMEAISKFKWPKNGYRKLKLTDRNLEADTTASQGQQLSKGINAGFERNKSCLDSCDDCYDKQLYGWYGAIQRQIQRSQYQMQYGRPIQVIVWVALLLCLIVFITVRVI